VSKSTILAESQIINSGHDTVTVELIEADGMPAVVIVSWPLQPTVLHPQRFPDVAATLTRLFAGAATELASIKSRRKL
jgi:hypothetical protein